MILRQIVPVSALAAGVFALAVGCETSQIARVGDEPREAITYAATAKYPGEAQLSRSSDIKVAAIDNPNMDQLELLNLTDNSIPASTLWVNGAFVRRIPTIPPRGTLVVKYAELLEAGRGTQDLKSVNQQARKVELQTQQGLIAVQGPSKR